MAPLFRVCGMCVAFSNPECSKTGQKKHYWVDCVRLAWSGQINLHETLTRESFSTTAVERLE